MPPVHDPVTEALDRPRRSGWGVADAAFHGPGGAVAWVVTGSNGENFIRAGGATQAEAWARALDQAAACGMLAGWPRPGGAGGESAPARG